MRNLTSFVLKTSTLAIAAFVMWNAILDERARANVRGASKAISRLVDHAAMTYVGMSHVDDDEYESTEANRAWIAEQWRRAGY